MSGRSGGECSLSKNMSECIVIGSSKGLGAAFVQEILNNTPCRVYGISRTALEDIPAGANWQATGRYSHLQLDIASENAAASMSELLKKCGGRLCVIYNAAHIERDYVPGKGLDIEAFDRVNRTGIEGLRNVLAAFEKHLSLNGGILAGVSSFWGRLTPVSLPYVSYPATKAYLDSLFHSLKYLCPPQMNIVTITIGNIKEGSGRLPAWFIPTYDMAARYIVRRLFAENTPCSIEYPCWHALLYKYLLRLLPERLLPLIFGVYLKLESRSGIPPHGRK